MPIFGVRGPAGTTGPQGSTGATGATGAEGAQGPVGSGDAVLLSSYSDIQAACNAAAGRWLELQGSTTTITQPLILAPDQRLRRGNITAHASFAPVDTNGAMVMQRQGAAVAVSSANAGTDVITTAAHNLSAGHIGVAGLVFQGASLPGGIVAGRVYYVDSVPSGTTLTIRATRNGSTFDVTSTGTGTCHLEVNSLQKVYWYDVLVDGNDVTGINGVALGLQQQSELRKVRIQYCPGTALVLYGQQAHFDNLQIFDCGTGVAFEDAKMMYFFTTSIEGLTKAVHSRDAQVFFGGGCANIGFWGVHHETTGATDVCFDIEAGCAGFEVEAWLTNMSLTGQKFLHAHNGNAANTGYSLGPGYFSSIALDGAYLIYDEDREHMIRQAEAPDGVGAQRRTPERYVATPFASNTPGSKPDRYPVMYLGQGGRFLGMAAQNDGVESFCSHPGTAQTGHQMLWEETDGSDQMAIDEAAYLRWIAAGKQQTTVGAAGGASAPPATPVKWLKVKDASGTVLVIPAYAA